MPYLEGMGQVMLESYDDRIITAETISKMYQLSEMGKIDQIFREHAGRLVHSCPPKDYLCEITKVFNTVKSKIRYQRDPHGVEAISHYWVTMQNQFGDCDDLSLLLGAYAGVLGFPYKFVTIGSDPSRPTEFSHVYVIVNVPKYGWLGLDATIPESIVGWEPERFFIKKIWDAPKTEVALEGILKGIIR